MEVGAITSHIDVAQVVLYAFWIFFAGLIFYLRREDRREGYPLESEVTGKPDESSWGLWVPEPKVFLLPHGGTATAPDNRAEPDPSKLAPTAPWSGAPFEPTGNPMLDGVGPGAYAVRSDEPEVMEDGSAVIVPMRVATDYAIAEGDADLIGADVYGGDGARAGAVKDIWIDRVDQLIRYIEIELPSSPQASTAGEGEAAAETPSATTVLAPMTFADIRSGGIKPPSVRINAIYAKHFADVPRLKNPDQITALEEEKVSAYYGAGTLYAHPSRVEPMV
jgi:photosynthetic reaction center H subunit